MKRINNLKTELNRIERLSQKKAETELLEKINIERIGNQDKETKDRLMKHSRSTEAQFDMSKAYQKIDNRRRKTNLALQCPSDLPLVNSNEKENEIKIFQQIGNFNIGLDNFLITLSI